MNPFDVVRHLTEKTDEDVDLVLETYSKCSFLVNRAMSHYNDCLFLAEYMTKYPYVALDIELQYDFYYNFIPKGKRRSGKWHKPDTDNSELINIISDLFECNEIVAKKFLKLMDDETREKLLNIKGGKNNDKKNNQSGSRS